VRPANIRPLARRATVSAVAVAVVATGTLAASAATASAAPAKSATIRTSSQLSSALASARPGQVLQLADGTYKGNFVAKTSGTSSAPIVLRGGPRAVLQGTSLASGTTLQLLGASNWRLEGFSVRRGQKGVVLDKSNRNVLTGLNVGGSGMEAVHFRSSSSDNRIERSSVHDTGLVNAGYGEGIYLGSAKSNWSKYGNSGGMDRSDRNQLVGNRIWKTTAESIDVKEGTVDGVISGNSFDGVGMKSDHFADSWIDLKGNRYKVTGNTGVNTSLDGFQTHVQLKGWGEGNVFRGNKLTVSAKGYGINLAQAGSTRNVVGCDNVVKGGVGRSNASCS
jgi:hypothetical protein